MATTKKKPVAKRSVRRTTTKKRVTRAQIISKRFSGGFEARALMIVLSGSALVLAFGFTGFALFQKMSASASSSATASSSLTTLISNAGSASSLTLSSGTYTFNDFGNDMGGVYSGAQVPTTMTSFTGAGIDKSVLKMTTGSSTKASLVPTANGTTNQLYLMLFQGAKTIGNFTLAGTTQGHLYNGIMLYKLTSPKLTNVKVTSVPGNDNSPPGETFGINDYKNTNATYNNIEVDGGGTGASGIGFNGSTNPTINTAYLHQNTYAMGVTFWKTAGGTLNNVKSSGNRTAMNFEEDTGTFTINNPTFGTSSSGHDINVGSDAASIKLIINNPTFTGGQTKLRINVASVFNSVTVGAANVQKKSDIKVYVNGVDKTSSLVTWLP